MDNNTGARIYCARGLGRYGFGFSKYQALNAACTDESQTFIVVMLPYRAHAPYVDMMGTLHWSGDDGDCEEVGAFCSTSEDADKESWHFEWLKVA